MGKTVKRKIILRRIVLAVSKLMASCFVFPSRPDFCKIHCRFIAHNNAIQTRNTNGATVVATNRSWKLLSRMQLSGNADRSKFKNPNSPQKDVNSDGSVMGYRVATLDKICVNVTKI